VEVRILAPVASDVGEICVSGAHVSRGYINAGRPSAEDRHFEADGKWWYRTGDFGYEDAKGRLWIAGRAGTAVRQKSGAMYPIPLEAMIDELPFVRRSALVGLGNADAAQQLRLNVELEPGTPLPGGWETEVRSMCARGSWRLEEIRVVRRIPMDRRHNARIDYRRLRARGAAA
jgi:acyl-CoA synthetase (AMP-forming)/AMP-acid ligase II